MRLSLHVEASVRWCVCLLPEPCSFHWHLRFQVWQAVEVFSGKGVLSNALRRRGFTAASLDILDWAWYVEDPSQAGKQLSHSRNPLDLLTAPGYASLVAMP